MEKIFDFENIEKYEKNVQRYKNLLDFNEIFILNRNLNNLAGTESYFEIYEAIKNDINENVNFLESVCMVMGTKNKDIQNIEVESATFSAIELGDFKIKRKENSFTFSYQNEAGIEVKRDELRNFIKNFLNEKVFGYFHEVNDQILNFSKNSNKKFDLSEEMKKVGRSSESLYDKKDKWGYAKSTERRLLFQKTIDNCIEKFKFKIMAIQKDGKLNDYIDTVEGSGSARVIDLKNDSLIFKKDIIDLNKDKIKFEILNPKELEISDNLRELIKNNNFIKNVELDSSTDLKKVEFLLKQIQDANLATDISYTFKVRLLGRHNTSSIYIKGMDENDEIAKHVVALDLRSSFSFVKELAIHIDSTTFNPNKSAFIDQISDYFDKTIPSDSQLIGKAAELSYLLNLSKLPELVEAIKIAEELDFDDDNLELQQKYKELLKVLNLDENTTLEYLENNYFKVLKNNSFSNGLVQDFSYYENNSKEYFNFKERNLVELINLYNYYQKMFNFNSEIKMDHSQTPLGQTIEKQKLREIRKYKRREGLETYTKEDFIKVKDYILDGTLPNYTLSELVEDAMVLDYRKTKITNFRTFIINEIMDRDERIKNKIITYDTFQEFNFTNIDELKDYRISFSSNIKYEENKTKELLLFFKKYLPSKINQIFSSDILNKVLDELNKKPGELKNFLLNEPKDSFFYSLTYINTNLVFKNNNNLLWNHLLEALKKDELDINNLKSTLDSFARNFGSKDHLNWAMAIIGTNLNKFTKIPDEFSKDIIQTLFEKSTDLEFFKDKIIIMKKLIEAAKTFKIDLEPKNQELKIMMIILSHLDDNKRLLPNNELKKLCKEIDLDTLKEKIIEYTNNANEFHLSYYLKIDEPKLTSLINEVETELIKEKKKNERTIKKEENIKTTIPKNEKYIYDIDFSNANDTIKEIEYTEQDIKDYYKKSFKEDELRSLGF